MLKELILKNRSYRRFYGDHEIERKTLEDLIDLARISSSAANSQPLKYLLINDLEKKELLYPRLKWAGYIKDWDGPVDTERPSAYICVLWDKGIKMHRDFVLEDMGLACQNILLGAVEKGLGGCMIGNFNMAEVTGILEIPDTYEMLLIIALGKPKEEIVLDPVGQDGSIKYWRDEQGIHHVPKRSLEDIIL